MTAAMAAAPIKATMDLDSMLVAPPVLPDGLGVACPLADPPLAVVDSPLAAVDPLLAVDEPVIEDLLFDAPVEVGVAAAPVD